ncbi:TrbG/VirB9 family P-type conjugative transfer protein [Blastomonas sp.]|uniref:TrbG/VirB9 family P-type conjugative transfer protein n=1 Tax=Blastomonas sp. TaxID=1909299 RepID=UPI0035935FD4
MRIIFAVMCLFLTAARTPVPGPVDPHIQTVFYNADEVVLLRGALGWQIMVEFAPDERIENVAIGDALAWQVTPNKRARNLFLKPLGRTASTNLTVVTDRRRYAFSLEVAPRSATTPWIVRFDYPREIVVAVEEPLPPPPPPMNYNYAMTGDIGIVPTRVWDDGLMTYFEFGPGKVIPAIFAGGPGKDETLVNSSTRGRVMIVQHTGGRFTLRTGKQVATVTPMNGATP